LSKNVILADDARLKKSYQLQSYTPAPAASKNDAQFKSGQNQLKNNHLVTTHSSVFLFHL
jgi:hypothetical protein